MSENAAITTEINTKPLSEPKLPSFDQPSKPRRLNFESMDDLKFLRSAMLGESQDDAAINTLARGFRRDFGRGLSSSSEIESSEESLIVNGRNGVIDKDRFLKEAREELEARLEKEIDEKGQSSEANLEPEKPDFK